MKSTKDTQSATKISNFQDQEKLVFIKIIAQEALFVGNQNTGGVSKRSKQGVCKETIDNFNAETIPRGTLIS